MPLRYVALAAALAAPTDPPDADNQPFWTGHPDAATFERTVDARLTRARGLLAELVGVTGRRNVANTLVPYDRLMRELDRAGGAAGLIQKVHPDTTLRQAADRSDRKVSALATEISLDRRVFDAVRTMDLSGADDVTRHYVSRVLRDFRLAGVDRDEATRARIKALREELGDFLFEAVFLAELCAEAGHFTIADSIQAVTDKLIRRHPHVFTPQGEPLPKTAAITATGVKEQWDDIKAVERTEAGKPVKTTLSGIPRANRACRR